MKLTLTWRYSVLLVLTVTDSLYATASVCGAQSNTKTRPFLNKTSLPQKDVYNALELQVWWNLRLFEFILRSDLGACEIEESVRVV